MTVLLFADPSEGAWDYDFLQFSRDGYVSSLLLCDTDILQVRVCVF